jgi:hypothetical protein
LTIQGLVKQHFRQAIKAIDTEFGEGYAKEHPELLGQYLQAEISVITTQLLVKSTQTAPQSQEQSRTVSRQERRKARSRPRTR